MIYAVLVAAMGLAYWAYTQANQAQANQNALINTTGVSGILNISDTQPLSGSGGQEITNDPSTWPSGDRIWNICHAVAYAEGANIAGSVPDRNNNPGDISDWADTYGSTYSDGSDVTTFPDKWTGWEKLYNKWLNIINGNSSVYSPSMTWVEIAQHWAGDWSAWANNVSSHLGVNEQSPVKDYVNG